jgi:hypothetical protein
VRKPNEVFWAVSDEVVRLFGTELAAVGRFEPTGGRSIVVGAGRTHERWELADFLARPRCFARAVPPELTPRAGSRPRARPPSASGVLGIVSTVASPIVVEGSSGARCRRQHRRAPSADTEERLEKFTELVATAIANAESREARAVLTEEQAALRRVATLVQRTSHQVSSSGRGAGR